MNDQARFSDKNAVRDMKLKTFVKLFGVSSIPFIASFILLWLYQDSMTIRQLWWAGLLLKICFGAFFMLFSAFGCLILWVKAMWDLKDDQYS